MKMSDQDLLRWRRREFDTWRFRCEAAKSCSSAYPGDCRRRFLESKLSKPTESVKSDVA